MKRQDRVQNDTVLTSVNKKYLTHTVYAVMNYVSPDTYYAQVIQCMNLFKAEQTRRGRPRDNYTVFRKKHPLTFFFHILMIDVLI